MSIVNLPDAAASKTLLRARMLSSPVGGVVVRFSELLSNFNLPDLPSLFAKPPDYVAWKNYVKKYMSIRSQLNFLNDCADYHVSDCTTKLSKPLRHWSSTVGNVRLTRLNNFRIRRSACWM